MEGIIQNNQRFSSDLVLIGEYSFDPVKGTLSGANQSFQLEPQVSALLQFFVEHAGDLISKDEISEVLWKNRVVSDDAFRAVIKKLRKAFADDARSPRYIQTIPLKGYRLIAEVKTQESIRGGFSPGINLLFLLVVMFAVASLIWASLSVLHPKPNEPQFRLLTTMDGSELRQSYNARLNQLVFSHRQNKDDFLQLYTKSLTSGEIRRLSFGDANYSNGHISPDGKYLAFTRSTPSTSQTYVANFSPDDGLSNIQPLPVDIANNRYLQAWSASGDGLYLSDLNTPDSSKGIAFYNIQTESLSQLTKPGGLGRGDVFARESNDGSYLAILRHSSPNENELIIQHKNTGEITHAVLLSSNYSQLVWSESDEEIVLSSFHAAFARYRLEDKHYEVLNIDANNVNDVFFSCGERCVYARQHDGNYLDLDFQPNPFTSQQVAFQSHIQADGAESFPVFGPRSGHVYYVNKQDKETQVVRSIDGEVSILARFPIDVSIASLGVNANETYVSGIVNNRLFSLELRSGALTYLSTDLETIVSMNWHSSSDELYFARIEQNEPVLYRYEFNEMKRVREATKRYAMLTISNGQTLIIDSRLNVWIESDNQAPRLITKIEHASSNRWNINNNSLYYTSRSENLAHLNKVDLASGESKSTLLAKNRFQIQFDLTDDGLSMVGVRSVLAQSNTVEMRY